MFEKGLRGGISQATFKYAKANNKYMKSYVKIIKSSYLQYLDANNLYGWAMCKTLPVGGFKWDDTSKYTEEMIKIMMKMVKMVLYSKEQLNVLKNYKHFIKVFHFYLIERK